VPGVAKLVTVYGEKDQPIEQLFFDAPDRLLRQFTLTYDVNKNLVEVSQQQGHDVLRTNVPESPQECTDLFGAMLQLVVRYRYDQQGRKIETLIQMGPALEEIKTITYNEHGDQSAQISEEHTREFSLNEEGQLAPIAETERVSRSETRFTYEYDDRGNWTSKTTASRSSPEQEFSIFSIEKRTILYFE
jgi:YD repeat-containing protein